MDEPTATEFKTVTATKITPRNRGSVESQLLTTFISLSVQAKARKIKIDSLYDVRCQSKRFYTAVMFFQLT